MAYCTYHHRAAFRRYLQRLSEKHLVQCRRDIGRIPATSSNRVNECLADIADEFKARDRAADRAAFFAEGKQ